MNNYGTITNVLTNPVRIFTAHGEVSLAELIEWAGDQLHTVRARVVLAAAVAWCEERAGQAEITYRLARSTAIDRLRQNWTGPRDRSGHPNEWAIKDRVDALPDVVSAQEKSIIASARLTAVKELAWPVSAAAKGGGW